MIYIYKLLKVFILFFIAFPASGQGPYDDLLKASQSGDVRTVRDLVSRGMSPDSTDPGGNSLLILAAREGKLEVVRELLSLKARPQARNAYGETALMLASLKGHLPIVRLLIERGAEVNQPGWSALHYCATEDRVDVCKYLLQKGANIDALSLNGTTPLMMAVRGGNIETARLLLWEVADAKIKNDAGATALQWALKSGHTDLAALLRQAGATE